MTTSTAGLIDVTTLPEDVVALIDALGPGEELVVTRAGVRIATVSAAGEDIEFGDQVAGEPLPTYDNVTVVATAMKLPASARTKLSAELGPDYIVLDLHAAPTTADVVLVPPASPQLIGRMRAMFPQARVIIAELEDRGLGVSYTGPIRRMLDAGAEAYLTPASVPRLARQLDHTVTHLLQLEAAAQPEVLAIDADLPRGLPAAEGAGSGVEQADD